MYQPCIKLHRCSSSRFTAGNKGIRGLWLANGLALAAGLTEAAGLALALGLIDAPAKWWAMVVTALPQTNAEGNF